MPNVVEKFDDDEYKYNMLNKEYIEKNFNIKLKFGNIINYGDYYMINKDNEFIYLENISIENHDNINCLIIPRSITKYLNNSIEFLKNIDLKGIKIGKIELDKKDNFLINLYNLEKEDKLNGINFNYLLNKDSDYDIELELNYLNKKFNYEDKFPTFKNILKKDISLLKIIDFHNKISNHLFLFKFKIYGPPNTDIKPIWSQNILIKDINKFISTTDKDSFYECTINCTLYEKFNNINIIKTQFSKELFSNDNNISMMINHGDFLEYSNKTELEDFINENDIFKKI